MFMHGGIAHIAGNMLFLWIFGDNLEHAMGHGKYLFFYLLCGVLAGMSHVLCSAYLNQSTLVPSLGASGAISGVLGGYILLFPRRGVHVWVLFTHHDIACFFSSRSLVCFSTDQRNGYAWWRGSCRRYCLCSTYRGFYCRFIIGKIVCEKQAACRSKKEDHFGKNIRSPSYYQLFEKDPGACPGLDPGSGPGRHRRVFIVLKLHLSVNSY